MSKINVRKWDIIKNWQVYLLGVPALTFFVMFTIVPLFGIQIAFMDYNILDGYQSPWADPWYANFKFWFTNPECLRLTKNVLLFNIFGLFFGTAVNLVLAIMLSEIFARRTSSIYQTIMLLPYFLSLVVLGKLVSMMTNFDNGVINNIVTLFGGERLDFDKMTWQWFFIVHLASTWKGAGYGTIIYLATMNGIDQSIYEAADIDGAGRWKRITAITLPMLKPLIILNMLMSIGRMFNGDFLLIQSIVGYNVAGLTYTDNIETFIYRAMTQIVPPQYSMLTAVGLYQSVLGCALIFLSNFIVKKYDPSYALF